jgi:L-alanine-DL-glutamate epimerase-like enolase superfamily enzyme
MRITHVDVVQLRKPMAKPLVVSRGALTARSAIVVLVHTDEGTTGLGESVGDPAGVVPIIRDQLAPLLIGEDPFDIERLWDKMYASRVYWDLKGALVIAMSGIDIALWDIKGKSLGVPVYQLLGGACRDKIRAYASDLFWDEPEVMARAAAAYVRDGFGIVKTHIGRDPDGDIARLRVIRNAIGDHASLMVDINCGYDRPTALRMGKRFQEFNPFWYEEPLRPQDVEGCRQLRSLVGIPIATGENEFTKHGFIELFKNEAVDYVMPDPARVGGITETKKIAALAEAFNLVVTPHNFSSGILLAATLHVIASTPNADLLELDVTGTGIYEELLVEPLKVDSGFVDIPRGPGLGVALTDAVRERYTP